VTKCLSSLRSRLHPEDCIQTVYKRGYRLISEVRSQTSSTAGVLLRLAIPPFVTHTGVPDHLGSAIAEEAISRLSNAPKPIASILARDSVFTLAKRGLAAQQIGETLKADLILSGTVRALISHFRLRVEMIRVADGVQLWAEDLLAGRDKIAGLESKLAARLDFRLQTRALDLGKTSSHPAPTFAVDEAKITTSSTKRTARRTGARTSWPSPQPPCPPRKAFSIPPGARPMKRFCAAARSGKRRNGTACRMVCSISFAPRNWTPRSSPLKSTW
jgi:TolB-like protein